MDEIIEFTAVLKTDERGPMMYIDFPYDVKEMFGTRGNVKVKITYDGIPHRGLLTNMGGSCHFLGINKALRAKIGKAPGEPVFITLQRDTEERIVEIPEDLAAAFAANPAAQACYDKLSYTHRKEYVQWITGAKRPETRSGRVLKTIEMLMTGKKNPSEK